MRIVLVGFGVVGRSFAELILEEGPKLDRHYGLRPRLVGIVDSGGAAEDQEGLDIAKALKSKQGKGSLEDIGPEAYAKGRKALDAIKNIDCEVVVECTPTDLKLGEPGLSHVKAALMRGRHVVCTNKGPLAIAMPALLELAQHNSVLLKFSGTVGGGTPVLDFAKRCLEGSTIRSISGILNGTSNFVLSQMTSKGIEMKDALAEAQRLGYAEADPTYDIGGFDTACKLVITSNYVLGTAYSIHDVDIQGIQDLSIGDLEKAKAKGKVVKLIGRVDGKAKVSTEMIDIAHPLNVSGTFNAVSFDTYPAGEITLVGKGAGGRETASSILRDLIEIRRSFAR